VSQAKNEKQGKYEDRQLQGFAIIGKGGEYADHDRTFDSKRISGLNKQGADRNINGGC